MNRIFQIAILALLCSGCNNKKTSAIEYEVTLNGQNFEVLTDNNTKTVGFYVIRVVKAKSSQKAKEKAIKLLMNDPELTEITVNELENPPMIYVEEINLLQEPHDAVNTGFSFYSDIND